MIKSGRPKHDINKDAEIKRKLKTTTCNVCNKKNKIINKGVLCKTCFFPIQRKCCKLKLRDMHDIGKDEWEWVCLTCTSEKFLFTTVEDKEIIKNGFKSNFHCKCQTTSNFDLGDSKFRFQYLTEKYNLDKSFNNTIEENDTFMNTFDQKPNFDYYQSHQFHKLVNKLPENKTLSLLHT